MGGTGMKEVRGAVFAGSSPPFLGRERAAVDVGVKAQREEFGFNQKYRETLVWFVCLLVGAPQPSLHLPGKHTTHKGILR